MSDRLTAGPGSSEFLVALHEMARQSAHPTDKVLTRVLAKEIAEAEGKNGNGA